MATGEPTSWVINRYNCKCRMYHHESTDQPLFRCASICASQQISRAMELCLMCQALSGDTSWTEVHSWTEWRDSSGHVVDSNKGEKQGWCFLLLLLFLLFLFFFFHSSFLLLIFPSFPLLSPFQAMQACCYLGLLCSLVIVQLGPCFASGLCWLMSSPGLYCCKGDGLAQAGEWSERCATRTELVGRFQNTRKYFCESCYYSCCAGKNEFKPKEPGTGGH
jgi:hypothetical protein